MKERPEKASKVSEKDIIELKAEKIIKRASRKVGYDRKSLPGKVKDFLLCAALTFLFTLGAAFVGVVAVIWICMNGPSAKARELLVSSLKETSAAGFVAHLFVPDIEIEHILFDADDDVVNGDTDKDLIQIPEDIGGNESSGGEQTGENTGDAEEKDVEVIDVVGPTYNGKLVIVKDPSRVKLGVSGTYGAGFSGQTLETIVKKYDGLYGVNASGFEDEGGSGSGAVPVGLVVSEGVLLWGDVNTKYDVIGFDSNNILIIDTMTAGEAIERGIRDAMSFGPFLVKNGTPIYKGGGVNPRTAIGQRADGAVILAVIEGRQISSIGATMRDLTNLMLDYGAVNAANLDGGSSSSLYGNGKYIIEGSYIFGTRKIPNAFIVTKKQIVE
ncbi:MAG: phosphodiester glycosidase family protein [Lachnospiraceae bacterium]|nr:phosphodiester glycosidase family protein [Lachnospiraceae bacterium]